MMVSGEPVTSADQSPGRAELIHMLAAALGLEKASEVVTEAASELNLPSDQLSSDDVQVLLGKIAESPGIVGMAASLAKSRLHFLRASGHLST